MSSRDSRVWEKKVYKAYLLPEKLAPAEEREMEGEGGWLFPSCKNGVPRLSKTKMITRLAGNGVRRFGEVFPIFESSNQYQ